MSGGPAANVETDAGLALTLGARCVDGGCRFRLWAPRQERVELLLLSPREAAMAMQRDAAGYHEALVEDVAPGTRYQFRLTDGRRCPDPASRLQPEGVHGPSEVVAAAAPADPADWRAPDLADLVLYELHVGTFSEAGTFAGILPYIEGLRELGVTAIELMPVAQFPGTRNWGYDGVGLFAVQRSYGGPEGLRRLVAQCHQQGMAVHLDVVYNHLGPEGNYLGELGPYFTDRYRTPWGPAVNFDGADSDAVRRFFLENALAWLREYRIDGLRLDALHAIHDRAARPFLEELVDAVRREEAASGRRLVVIGESDLNDPRLLEPPERGGPGLDGVWNDDFHHSLHALLTGERQGYYQDFGEPQHLAHCLRRRYVYIGQHSQFRRRRHGRPADHLAPERFVVCAQNHDQVGNRLHGDRLATLVDLQALKLAVAAVLLSPFTPLLFMGEEYGETAPFLYFVSHTDPDLAAAVREGRRREFAAFGWDTEPPDPQSDKTFRRSRLQRERATGTRQRALRAWYRELLRLRRESAALQRHPAASIEAEVLPGDRVLLMRRRAGAAEAAVVLHLADGELSIPVPLPAGDWQKELDAAEERWAGPGARLGDHLVCDGRLELPLSPWGVVMLVRRDRRPAPR